jgi:hypothetical protein
MRSLLFVLCLGVVVWGVIVLVKSGRLVDPRDVGGNLVCEKCDQRREHPHGYVIAVVVPPCAIGGGR